MKGSVSRLAISGVFDGRLYFCRYTVPHFYLSSFFSKFLRCPQLYKYYAYRLPILRQRGKARGVRICSSFWIGVRRFLASPSPFPPLLLAQRRNLPMIFLYQFFPHFGAEYFSRGTCCRLSSLLACLLCSAFFLILGRVCFLSVRNGLLGLSRAALPMFRDSD